MRGISKKNRGSVLVTVLWLITTMALFAIGLTRITSATYRFAKRQEGNVISADAVNAIVMQLKSALLDDITPDYDTFSELLKGEKIEIGQVIIVYSISDETSRININTANSATVEKFPSLNSDKATEIRTSEYRPFYPKEELMMIDEIDEDIYNEIKDIITVYGSGRININTCSEDILEYIGLDQGLIDAIVVYRKGEDGEEGTEDDGFFESTDIIVSNIKERFRLTAREEQEISDFITKNIFGVNSDHYRIEADVYLNKKPIKRFLVIMGKDVNNNDYKIKEWKEA